MDYKTWYQIGIQVNFTHSADPSFFPLPRTTPGAGAAPAGATQFTHVYKASTNQGCLPGQGLCDSMQVIAAPLPASGSSRRTELRAVKI